MLQHLDQRGVPIPVLRLLRSYFCNRTQVVKSGHFASTESPVPSGIAQGSLLGPRLFNVFIDDVFSLKFCSAVTVVGYADDLLLIAPASSVSDISNLQLDLDRVATFYESLGLCLNVQKSKTLLTAISPQVNFSGVFFTVLGQPLPVVAELKYLGVVFARSLRFDVHCERLASRSKQMLGVLFSSCKGIGTGRLRHLYIAKILPLLLYALPVSCPSSKLTWFKLERVHRFACRLLTNDFCSPYTVLLKSLRFECIQDICICRQLLLCYKYVHGLRHFPVDLDVPNSVQNHRHNLRRRGHSMQLKLPGSVRLGNLPVFIVFRAWNMFDLNPLPLSLSPLLFRQHLKHAQICAFIRNKLFENGLEKYFFSVSDL